MNKPSMMYFLIMCLTSALAAYHALFPIQAGTAIIRFLGLEAFMLVCISLIIGPLAVLDAKFAPLIEPRRSVGLASFMLFATHFLIVATLYFGWDVVQIASNFPLLIGMAAGVLITAIALTSSDFALKTLGQGTWKSVQRLTYIVFPLAFTHFILKSNGLFVQGNGITFVNAAEIFALLLGAAAVLLQIAGFLARRQRMAKTAEIVQAEST